MEPLPPSRRARFTPRFTLGLLYVGAFFFLYALLFTVPALLEILRTVPPGPEQEELAKRAAYELSRPRLPIALVAAVVTVGLGAWARVLPGMRGYL